MNCTIKDKGSFLIIFATTRGFIKGRVAVEGLPYEVVNTPRELYEQCGMCLKFSNSIRSNVEQRLSPNRSDLIYLDE